MEKDKRGDTGQQGVDEDMGKQTSTTKDTTMMNSSSGSESRGENLLLEERSLEKDKESHVETLKKKRKECSEEDEVSNNNSSIDCSDNKKENNVSHPPLIVRRSSGATTGGDSAGRKQLYRSNDDDNDDSRISNTNKKNDMKNKKKFQKVAPDDAAAARAGGSGGGPSIVTSAIVGSSPPNDHNDMKDEDDAPTVKSLVTKDGSKPSSDAYEDGGEDDSSAAASESDDESEHKSAGGKRTRPTRKCRLESQRQQRTMMNGDDTENEELEESNDDSSTTGDDDDENEQDEIAAPKAKSRHDRKRSKKNNNRLQNDDDDDDDDDDDASEFEADLSETSSNEAEEDEVFMQGLIEQADNGDDDLQSIHSEETDPKERRVHAKDLRGYNKSSAGSHGDSKAIKSKVEALPMPTEQEQAEILSKLENPNDKNLQRLMWGIGCRYHFLPYQFLGVRSLAGVQDDYPQLASKGDDAAICLGQEDDELSSDKEDKLQPLDTQQVLQDTKFRDKNREVLMGDDMGLGKTVQAVGAALLRNAIAEAKNPNDKKPTIIISPNIAVTQQWADTLIKAGVQKGRIIEFLPKDPEQKLYGKVYVLMDRYKLQTHSKFLFSLVDESSRRAAPSSHLFPKVPKELLLQLKNQYESNIYYNVKNLYRDVESNEGACECVTRLLQTGMKSIRGKPPFRSVIIDESHFLKNLLSYWGLGAGLLGLFSERVIPVSGTPYNNNSQDLATLMTFIDPSHESANQCWWKQATDVGAAASVAKAVGDWKANMLVRREKTILGDLLTSKTIKSHPVSPHPLELDVYEQYGQSFLDVLDKFRPLIDDNSPEARFKKKQLYQVMLGFMALMRMSLIHNMLPGGRDLTIHFSPTRCHLAKSLTKNWHCVCCNKGKKRGKKRVPRSETLEMLGDDKLNDDNEEEDDEADFAFIITKEEENLIEKGDLVALPLDMCLVCKKGGLRHYAHQECLETLKEDGGNCPLCEKLRARAHLSSGKSKLEEMKQSAAEKGGGLKSAQTETPRILDIERHLYREDIHGGFVSSAKLTCIISYLTEQIPKEDKVLILSFFKGSLDLVEAMLYEQKIGYCRYDGDISHEERQLELDRFKSTPSCRMLLMTVQTGGTGLNICEANQVIFVDRWFNPFVHEQAQDRCHRLGQMKHVFVAHPDVSYTVDDVMRYLNEVKSANAKIVLVDGSSLGGAASSGVSYKDMTGLLGYGIRCIREARHALIAARPDNYLAGLPPIDSSIFEHHEDNSGFLRTPRSQSPYRSISEVMAQLLGYVNPQQATSEPRRVTSEAAIESVPSAHASTKVGTGRIIAPEAVTSAPLGLGGDEDDDKDVSVAGQKKATSNLIRTGRQRATDRSQRPDRTSSMSSASARPLTVQSARLRIAGYEDNDVHDDSVLDQKRRAFPAGQSKKATGTRDARKQSLLPESVGSSNETVRATGAGHRRTKKHDIVDLCKDDDDSSNDKKPRGAARTKPDIVDLTKDDDDDDDRNDKKPPRAACPKEPDASGIIDLCDSDKKSDDDDHDDDDDSSISL